MQQPSTDTLESKEPGVTPGNSLLERLDPPLKHLLDTFQVAGWDLVTWFFMYGPRPFLTAKHNIVSSVPTSLAKCCTFAQ